MRILPFFHVVALLDGPGRARSGSGLTQTALTGNTADAEDATQTAFLKAFQHLGDFEGAGRFGAWLTRIAINEGLECVRTRKPTESLSPEDDMSPSIRSRLFAGEQSRILAPRPA